MADQQEIRCFVGIPVAVAFVAAVQPVVAQLQTEPWRRKVRWVAPRNWHLTLAFLGNRSFAFGHDLQAALQSALPGDLGFELEGRWVCGFPDAKSRIIALEFHASPQLLQLKARLDQVLLTLGVELEQRPLRPHLTLGRVRRDQRIHFNPVLCDAVLSVRELRLFKSTLAAEGSEYAPLWTLPLSG